MFREYSIIFLLAHVLGDFYIQTDQMAAKKEKSMKWVLIHCLCYWGTMLLISLLFPSRGFAVGVSIAAVLHCFIDIVKFMVMLNKNKRYKISQKVERNVFIIDQLIHSIFLLGIAYWFVRNHVQLNRNDILEDFFHIIGVSELQVLSWFLAVLVIHKPANIAISKLLLIYKPVNKDEGKKNDNNAGRFIGTAERIIMLIFLSIGQYSAIGLVLTAKSIARYDRISKEKDFAEYYLLGTLISAVIVIVVSFMIL